MDRLGSHLANATHLALKFFGTISCAACTVLVGLVSYRLLLHPLADVPGPRLAAISNIWLAYQIRQGRARILGKTLHHKYGPAVRVGPNEVWFNSKDAFKAIYSPGSKFEKSDFYLSTALPRPELDWKLDPHSVDSLDLLSERDMKRYRKQRRLVGPVYQPSNLIQHEDAINAVLARLTEKLRGLQGERVDLKEWMHLAVVECLGAVVLSWSPGMLKHGTDWGTSAHAYQSWRRKSVMGVFPFVTKLTYLSKTLDRWFSEFWGITYKPPKHFKTFFPDVGKRVSKRINVNLHRQSKPGQYRDLMADLVDLHERKPDFTQDYLRRMAVTNFGAGHETLTSTLTSTFLLLGTNPATLQRLTTEVRTTKRASYEELSTMSMLQATVKESKRLRPVIGTSLPRAVPHGEPLRLHGHNLPVGTVVGINPVALHCNADICGSDPDRFDPERWLLQLSTPEDGSQGIGGPQHVDASCSSHAARIKDMETFSLAWGGGSRTCPGRNLAELILLKIIAELVTNFDLALDTVPSEDDMPAYFMSMPTGVQARFLPV